MKDSLLAKLREISPEEQNYLDGRNIVNETLYSGCQIEEIDHRRLLDEGRLITVRPHSRFIAFPEHRHNYIEIMYVCEGTITHYIDNRELIMQKGDMLLLNQHVRHAIKRAGYHDVGINFIALPEFFDIPLRMLKNDNILADFLVSTLRQSEPAEHYLLFRLGENDAIANLMENMISSMLDGVQNEDVMNRYSMGIVFLYLMQHMDCLTQNSSQSYRDIVVRSALNYINTHYRTANLTRLAADLHQSLSGVSKIIKKSTGHTFQEHLQYKRFQKAVMLLRESDLSVEEIVTAVGYENQSYFYRQFKKRYGETPRQYRMNRR